MHRALLRRAVCALCLPVVGSRAMPALAGVLHELVQPRSLRLRQDGRRLRGKRGVLCTHPGVLLVMRAGFSVLPVLP
jgi:hypothetical protein